MNSELSSHLLKELAILTNDRSYLTTSSEEEATKLIREYCNGNFGTVLQTATSKQIFHGVLSEDKSSFVSNLKNNVESYFNSQGDSPDLDKELEMLLVGVSCLQLYVQNNWLGPCPSTFTSKDVFTEELLAEKSFKDMVEAELNVDGEPIYELSSYPEFLLMAKVILCDCKDRLKQLQTAEWWMIRCLNIQQQILDDKANSLRETFIQLIQSVQKTEPLMVAECLRSIQILFHLEAGYLSHTFYLYREAKEHFNTAEKLSGLKINLTGAMGKRTRYQQTDKAQLMLEVTRELPALAENGTKTPEVTTVQDVPLVPKNLDLEDDTVLNAINFVEEIQTTVLTGVEQSLILGLMENHRRSRASDEELLKEEMQAFLTYALHEAKSWTVSSAALFVRSVMERKGSRRVDRAMRQVEELYNQSKRPEPSIGQRLQLFYSVSLPPLWKVQSQLAEILVSLGAIGSALEVFEKLCLWELAISCYQRLGKMEKAETIIREQLAIKETPNLWCFLGDVTQDISKYEKAWELSKHNSPRAMRCMGYLYFAKEEFKKCIECFQKSLDVNPLQIPVWFTYGCAAMAAKEFSLAVTAFRRCVNIDYDNYEAWSNMATSFVQLKEKRKAFMTMKDAIKCSYDNWRLWDNMLTMGTSYGDFFESIKAYHRLLDLKDKWIDEEVLTILVRAAIEDIPDAYGNPGGKILPKLKELFGRLTSKVTTNAEIWNLYSKLTGNDTEKTLQYLQKSHRCTMQTKDWEKKVDDCGKVSRDTIQLADAYMETMGKVEDKTKQLQLMSSAKLMLKGVLSKIKKEHTDPITDEIPSEAIQTVCTNLEEKIEIVVGEINKLK